ncbi:MAG: LptE family protein [Candidatus Omnitrophica bacterium]|nr:LptE family protein [Candidatus Omnitrophota bacterium]
MKTIRLPFFLLGVIAALASCGAPSPSLLKESHRSIHIAVFKNESQQFSLEERLTRAMISAFQRDGRLRVAPASRADLQLNGVIKSADVSTLSYTDLDRAIGYRMNIIVEVSVKDAASEEFLLENRLFHSTGTYLLSSELTNATSADVTAALSEQVLSALIEGW